MNSIRIHPTAEVSDAAIIGDGTSIWQHVQVREDVIIGQDCIIGMGVYIDPGVRLGSRIKIQNYVSVYRGVTLEDGVFIGPHVCFTNDLRPRAINPNGTLKDIDDWRLTSTLVAYGTAIGANSTIRCGVTIGRWAMIGAGSVVTKDVPDYGLALGNPARLRGFVCPCGSSLEYIHRDGDSVKAGCPDCGESITIPSKHWESVT